MRKWIFAFFALCFLFTAVSCAGKGITPPEFLEHDTGKAALQPLIFGSESWSLWHRQDYLFAVLGRHILRYDIPGNTIDRVIDLGDSYKNWPFGTCFSEDGRYIMSYSFDFGNEQTSRNYFLLDLEEESAKLLCAEYDEEKTAPYRFSAPKQTNFPITYRGPSDDEDTYHYFYTDSAGNTHEISALKNLGAGNYKYVGEDRIGAIVAEDPSDFSMGYYKFIVIDAITDTVLQECAINGK